MLKNPPSFEYLAVPYRSVGPMTGDRRSYKKLASFEYLALLYLNLAARISRIRVVNYF